MTEWNGMDRPDGMDLAEMEWMNGMEGMDGMDLNMEWNGTSARSVSFAATRGGCRTACAAAKRSTRHASPGISATAVRHHLYRIATRHACWRTVPATGLPKVRGQGGVSGTCGAVSVRWRAHSELPGRGVARFPNRRAPAHVFTAQFFQLTPLHAQKISVNRKIPRHCFSDP